MTGTAAHPGPPGGPGPHPELAPLDHPSRLAALRAALGDGDGLDALLVTKIDHIRYLTGFTGSSALLLAAPRRTVFVTDGRYRDQAGAELEAAGTSLAGGGVDELVVILSRDEEQRVVSAAAPRSGRIGLEAANVTWARQRELASRWFPDAELVPTEGLVEALREVKEPGEVARIAAAASIADAALAAVAAHLHEAPTEAEVALEIESTMRRLGADGAAFETIVASGPNAALPHARPGGRRLREGDLVVLDLGAVVDGYHSDMTRTLCLGPPSAAQQRLYDVVAAAQDAARALARAGAEASAVDGAARAVIEEAGWADAFSHGTGHGVGLEIHEAPYVGRTSTATLRQGSVITIEPGVYLPGLGGVRTEDTLLVGATGCQALTRSPKMLAS